MPSAPTFLAEIAYPRDMCQSGLPMLFITAPIHVPYPAVLGRLLGTPVARRCACGFHSWIFPLDRSTLAELRAHLESNGIEVHQARPLCLVFRLKDACAA